MKAARFYPPASIRVEEIPAPAPGPGEALIRVEVCGLCGSDVAKFAHGGARPGEVFGHEIAGIVEEMGRGGPTGSGEPGAAPKFRPGDRVVVAHHAPCFRCHYCAHGNFSMCRAFKASQLAPGGFAERLVASADHVAHTMFAVPQNLSSEAATFMEPLACALKAVPRLNLRQGDLVVVFGLGPMGILFARLLARREGCRVIGVDPIAPRRAAAARDTLALFAPDDPALPSRILDQSEGRGADAIVLAAGRGALVASALPLLREGGAVCLFAASPDEPPVPLPLTVMYYREVLLFGSYSPNPEGFADALRLLASDTIPVRDLVTHRLPLEETGRAFGMAMRGEGLKIMVHPGSRAIDTSSAAD